MKKLLKLIAVAAMLAACVTVNAADNFGIDNRPAPSGYSHANFTTNNAAILIPGSTTTNFPATAQYILAVPANGFGVFLRTGGTNAADTTNLTVTLEGVIFPTGLRSAGTQVVDNATYIVRTPTTASALPTGYDYLTNFAGVGSATVGLELMRCDGIRVKSIQNTNLGSIWVSNFFQIRD